jgi:hypothetical protein
MIKERMFWYKGSSKHSDSFEVSQMKPKIVEANRQEGQQLKTLV